MKKNISIIIALVLIAAIFTGCADSKPVSETEVSAPNATEEATESSNFNATGYPIVNETVKLQFFAPKSPIHGPYKEMHLFQKMEELSNLDIEWVTPPTENFETQKNLAFASEKLPDAFFLWINRATETTHGADGSFIPLEGLIDQYAPNYKGAMEAFPNLRPNTTSLDGHIYATGIVQDVPRDLTFKQWINKTWIDNLGMNVPTTVDELYGVLKAFKDQDPNQNGDASDEIPLSCVNLGQTRNFVLSAFGFVSNGIEAKDNNVLYVPAQDAYRAYLTYMNKLYAEGLLDNDTFTMPYEQLAAKGNEGVVGCFDHAAPFLAVGEAMDGDYIALSPLTSEINDTKMWLKFSDVWTGGFAITKDNAHPEATMRWYDILFSEEGKTWQSFGVEGVDWKWVDDEKSRWVFTPDEGMDPEQYRGGKVTPAAGMGAIAWWSKDFVLKEQGNPLVARINEQVTAAEYEKYWREPFPLVYFTAEEQKEINVINSDLQKYVSEMEAKFIAGREALDDANWATYLETLNSMGLEEYVKYHQTAYDRWNQ